MTIEDLNQRIKDLESLVCRLIEGKVELRNIDLQPYASCAQADFKDGSMPQPEPPALRFYYSPDQNEQLKCYGSLEGGKFGAEQPALYLRGESGAHVTIQSNHHVSIHAAQYFTLNAKTINFEATQLNMDGEISARIRYTDPFVWRSGQPPLKMINQDAGFPVITQIKGEFSGTESQVKTYIDANDGYWYLFGTSKKKLEIHAIVVGRV
ncbi:MAG: hypothetical protein DHS20C18_25020 [Saprospiraceae bacterium]|nr:MAG: hypothetical protein DHS20C18_25020 [Saprospiraceae bacterium]